MATMVQVSMLRHGGVVNGIPESPSGSKKCSALWSSCMQSQKTADKIKIEENKEKGHVVKDCPKKKEQDKSGEKTPSPFKVAPKDNESHQKNIGKVECPWCQHCKHWTSGKKHHLSGEHWFKKGTPPAGATTPGSTPSYATLAANLGGGFKSSLSQMQDF